MPANAVDDKAVLKNDNILVLQSTSYTSTFGLHRDDSLLKAPRRSRVGHT